MKLESTVVRHTAVRLMIDFLMLGILDISVSVRLESALASAAPLLHLLEMKFVVISYDGDISFPEGRGSGHKKSKPIHPNLENEILSL